MLDINWMCQNADLVRAALKDKRADADDLENVLVLNAERKSLQHRSDTIKRERKSVSADFQKARKAGEDTAPIAERSNALKEEEKTIDRRLGEVKRELEDLALRIPNIPHSDAPKGGEEANAVVRIEGQEPPLGFDGLDHLALGEKLGIVDAQNRGVKVAGSGFVLFQGQGARLARALINFMLDLHTEEHGYTEVSPPFLVNEASMIGTGQLPKFKDDMYHCEADGLYLIPTAEVPVTNLLRGEILDKKRLPIAYTAYTPCFRREAGSYGADTRGLMRLHQFDKVEMVRFCKPEDSEDEHQRLLGHAEEVLKRLGLRYRVLDLATADMSANAARCYDLEAWAPVSKRWFEVSSVSNFRDYQARRASIRYRKAEKKVEHVHTLNGSGLALPRVILCLMEQYQTEDGAIAVPEALRTYMKRERIEAEAP